MSCVRMYSMITSSVTLAELATKKPLAQRCRPQHSSFRWLYSCNSRRELFPFTRCIR
jgi:hypothetical protein